ncbi:MAG: hypothetical protein N0C81_14750 [Candidatus Thiodiazotropha lotti]|nr:hypothetical protein [Candidatus Thiodiazotropha lotti]MCG8004555.1 hypothetical protein [Candidatus Thiodiazotropha lotti]MCG8008889.1 hypothetical protein [Candidatus Thiodiazotropha lotti]MCW4188181.1 hypothetical protein [Candidatus Thiodiazotropha lotti]MCW4196477.1 hypothetical protein [Candidatus Thiodiazotropha lotti]
MNLRLSTQNPKRFSRVSVQTGLENKPGTAYDLQQSQEPRSIVFSMKSVKRRMVVLFGAIFLFGVLSEACVGAPAMPEGVSFEKGINGPGQLHHDDKRSPRILINGTTRIINGFKYHWFNGLFYSDHANKNMFRSPTNQIRMTYTVADNIIKNGVSYVDNKTKRIVRVIHEDGGVVLSRANEIPAEAVVTVLWPKIVQRNINNKRFTLLKYRD